MLKSFLKAIKLETGNTTQWLRVLSALVEDGLLPGIHVEGQLTVIFKSRASDALF